ncbi:MAG: MBL fold metallo-hydrolase [Synergistes sp.]|nr:MBL fold metallo-hydrolase [Synergistes sp.]
MIKNNKKAAGRVFILSLLMLLLTASQTLAKDKDALLRYYALNVGQGDASLFVLPDKRTILVDTGPEENAGETVRYLKSCGVKKIDLLVATHPHEDHIGAARAVIAAFDVGQIWDPGYNQGSRTQRDYYRDVAAKKIPFGKPSRGYKKNMGDVKIEVLAPSKLMKGTHSDANNNSIVMLVTYGKISFLMCGDMEKEERSVIGKLPHATVLKAAHHGSVNGTDKKMLQSVKPDIVIFSYGIGNSYGHPHKEVQKLVKQSGILRFDTSHGAVKLRTDGKTIVYEKKKVVR